MKISFDPERMDAAAAALKKVRASIDAAADHMEQIRIEAVKDAGMRELLVQRRRRIAFMAHGDADEVTECVRRVRATAARARGADAPSRRPSRAQRKRRPKRGAKVGAGGYGKRRRYPGHKASPQQMACWLASRAAGMGAPPELLVSAALVESGLCNVGYGHAASTGLFQIQVTIHRVPPGFGSASGALKSKEWWQDHPEAQLKWFASAVKATDGQGRGPNTTGAAAVGGWAADIERPAAQYRGRYADRYDDARRLIDNCPRGPDRLVGAGGGMVGKRLPLAARIERGAMTMRWIENRPRQFAQMQARADSGGRAPWCAAYVYSAVLAAGKRLPGSGWAAVRTWVRRAQARQSGLRIISANDAMPGDLVAYDWGGGSDFSGDGHIGVLDTEVRNGCFRTIEGNTNGGTSAKRARSVCDANVVFIRVAA